ncbi:DUF4280 domain-containing protein [Pelosinus fermentans]|uniref:DUF4280 domain-containing protein n=2 Tax=Pelosinus TaxID=365348 RepID=I8RHD3_9FIRM|nr:DUF4280 domain-containing protein [Pelosinus fermentans]EIW19148.1 Protein of unknown function DUF4280 [Pelosinus fermentans B4]EIW25120.1 hypothetical protein FA11_2980 [Pelosinus fermentans A11]OAM96129.1 Protein of unknown function DUF4280 [Pelosinus fermentans DSM 17108]SDR36663.1 Protein of unknown function [Pelosinus fermentans]
MSTTASGPAYIPRGTKSKCSKGSSENLLNLPVDHGVAYTPGLEPLLNANDHKPGQHILKYGFCAATKLPCSPVTPLAWINVNKKHILEGAPALIEQSKLTCVKGGVISIVINAGSAELGDRNEAAGDEVEAIAAAAAAVNPSGTAGGPTVMEAAEMADHVYFTKSLEEAKQDTLPGGWQLDDAEEKESMRIGVYARTVGEGEEKKMEYTLVNRGTRDWSWSEDGDDNIKQPFGASDDVRNSLAYSKNFVKDHSDANITFVGHSKGGAEAAANAVETNKNAILFNPAAVNVDAYTPNGSNYSASMTAHIVDGEILHSAEGWFSKPIGSVEYLPAQYPTNTWNPVTNGENAVKNHSMDAVIDGIKEKGGEN